MQALKESSNWRKIFLKCIKYELGNRNVKNWNLNKIKIMNGGKVMRIDKKGKLIKQKLENRRRKTIEKKGLKKWLNE